MNSKLIAIFFVFVWLFFGVGDFLLSHPKPAQFFPDAAKLPRSFSISRAKPGVYNAVKTIYNPVEDVYVSFIKELDLKTYEVTIYSRRYNSKGKPVGNFTKILPITLKLAGVTEAGKLIMDTDVCFNHTDNKFLFIWSYFDSDGIYAIELNGRGTREDITSHVFTMKKQLNIRGSGGFSKVVWLAKKNQYAMGWLYLHHLQNNEFSPKSGYYLATFKSSLKPIKKMKKVRSLRLITHVTILSDFLAVGERLFWFSGEDADANHERPVVWVTNTKGKILSLSGSSSGGMIYPGKKVKYLGLVHAAYDPGSDLFLITWDTADNSMTTERKFSENYFRIMTGKGKFIGKEQKLLQVEPYQGIPQVTFDQMDDHFLVTCAEYKVLSDVNTAVFTPGRDGKSHWGGRLWGYKIDLNGKLLGSRIPLTKVFTDVNTSLYFVEAFYNASDDQHFLIYDLSNFVNYKQKAYGLIYK